MIAAWHTLSPWLQFIGTTVNSTLWGALAGVCRIALAEKAR
jgi:hypothetical protein